jgi:hypothetical protein
MSDADTHSYPEGESELLPCPLCRAEGHTLLRGVCYPDGSIDKEGAVMCPTCGCRATLKSWQTRPRPLAQSVNSTIPCHRGGHKCAWPACPTDCDGRPGNSILTVAQAAGGRDAFIGVTASLAAAISLLERTPNAKKAAPSDKMFEIMLSDYRKALEAGRAALAIPSTHCACGMTAAGRCPVCLSVASPESK